MKQKNKKIIPIAIIALICGIGFGIAYVLLTMGS